MWELNSIRLRREKRRANSELGNLVHLETLQKSEGCKHIWTNLISSELQKALLCSQLDHSGPA